MIRLPLVLARALIVGASATLLTAAASFSAAQPADSAGQNAIEGLEVGTESGKVIVKMKLKDTDETIPTLAEALAVVGHRAMVMIELAKQWNTEAQADHKEAGAKKDAQLHYRSEAKAKAAKALADQVK